MWQSRIQITFNSGDLAFREIILSRSCRDSGTRLVSQKCRFRWASMTGQSVNPEQPRGRGSDSARTWDEVKRRVQSCPYLYRVPVSGKRQSNGTKKWLAWMSPGIKQPKRELTLAALYELFEQHSQCVSDQSGKCPLLVFTQQMWLGNQRIFQRRGR